MKYLITLLYFVLLASCASQRPKEATDYENDLVYPNEVNNFKFVEKKVFDDPILGVTLRYIDIKNTSDFITVYVYPISDFNWDDEDKTLSGEMDLVIEEIDYIVRTGQYKSRSNVDRSDFIFKDNEKGFSGKKSKFQFVSKEGVTYDSFAYLFISQDKYIKFRTSFNSEYTPEWSGDEIVKTILPNIAVPPESFYMKSLRKKHEQQMKQQFINLLLEAVKNGDIEKVQDQEKSD